MVNTRDGHIAFGKLVAQIIKVSELFYPIEPFMSGYRQFSVKWTNEKELYCPNSLDSDSNIWCLLSLDTGSPEVQVWNDNNLFNHVLARVKWILALDIRQNSTLVSHAYPGLRSRDTDTVPGPYRGYQP